MLGVQRVEGGAVNSEDDAAAYVMSESRREMLLLAGKYLDGAPPPSELLVLPWGAVHRKSEFRGAFKVECKGQWAVKVIYPWGTHTWPEQGAKEPQVDRWLADIEAQVK